VVAFCWDHSVLPDFRYHLNAEPHFPCISLLTTIYPPSSLAFSYHEHGRWRAAGLQAPYACRLQLRSTTDALAVPALLRLPPAPFLPAFSHHGITHYHTHTAPRSTHTRLPLRTTSPHTGILPPATTPYRFHFTPTTYYASLPTTAYTPTRLSRRALPRILPHATHTPYTRTRTLRCHTHTFSCGSLSCSSGMG